MNRNGVADPSWRSKLPQGVNLHCWKRTSAAEFRLTRDGNAAAIGVTNLNDELSSQIHFLFEGGPGVRTTAGRGYRLRYEYRAQNEAFGVIVVRNPHNNTYPAVAQGQLTATGGAWRTGEVKFRRPGVGSLDAVVENRSVGEGNVVEVRALELFEEGQ